MSNITEDSACTSTTPESMEELGRKLYETRAAHRQFKRENRDVFETNKNFNTTVADLRARLKALMVERCVDEFAEEDFEVELKKKTSVKHNIDRLKELLQEGSDTNQAFDTYMNDVGKVVDDIVVRKRRRISAPVPDTTSSSDEEEAVEGKTEE